jgi:pSer/pThr/pTyr-binding forkhead associated (FHA) protein
VHKIGNRYEIEDRGGRAGTAVNGRRVRRHRLESGDQIVLGATVLEFEERRKGDPAQGGKG